MDGLEQSGKLALGRLLVQQPPLTPSVASRSAHELGYNVTFVTDAMTDMSEAAHRRALDLIFPRLGESGTTEELLAFVDKHRA